MHFLPEFILELIKRFLQVIMSSDIVELALFNNHNGPLLLEPDYSDLVVVCKGRSYHLHRNVVCRKSAIFARECEAALRVRNNRSYRAWP
jgi:hypothetical protein